MTKRIKTNTPFYRLRQKAPRALMVLERHKAQPVIGLFASTLGPAAQSFIEHFDETHAFEMARAAKALAQASAARHARERTSVWLAFLARDVPAFDATAYTSEPDSPVSVITAAERLLTFVGNLEADGVQLPYAAPMRDELSQALREASSHWNEARAGLNALQTRQADTRAHALAFERELIAFRRALKVLLGETDSDYQSLRITRRTASTETDTVEAPVAQAPALPEPAPLNGASTLLRVSPASTSSTTH